MQVKITYTTDFSDVPREVANILNMLNQEAESILDIVSDTSSDLNSGDLSTSKMRMSILKNKLHKMFSRITDCQAILEGFEKTSEQQKEQEVKSD